MSHSDFFKALRREQPYNEDLYLPCTLIDNHEVIEKIYAEIKPYPTHPSAISILEDKKLVAHLESYGRRMEEVYAGEWKEYKERCAMCSREVACK